MLYSMLRRQEKDDQLKVAMEKSKKQQDNNCLDAS